MEPEDGCTAGATPRLWYLPAGPRAVAEHLRAESDLVALEAGEDRGVDVQRVQEIGGQGGRDTPQRAPMDWWTVVNRCRALENIAYVVASNQAASLAHYPPFSWPGGSMIVNFEGRILAQADPGPGEKIVVGPIDIDALRHERSTRRGHQTLGHLRSECYPMYRYSFYPQGRGAENDKLSVEGNDEAAVEVKERLGYR